MENYDALKLCNQLCFPLYAAAREVTKRYKPYLDEIGLTYTQYIAMMVLWEKERISVKDLGEILFLDSGTLTPVLKSLEQKRLVKRTRLSSDERIVVTELTEEGAALKESAVGIPQAMRGCLTVTQEEAVTLYKLLYKILGSEK